MTYEEAKNKFAKITPSWRNNYKRLFILAESAAKDKREDCYSKQVFIKTMKELDDEEFEIVRPGSL